MTVRLLLMAVLSWLPSANAAAEDPLVPSSPAGEGRTLSEEENDSIDTESTAATALYVSGVVTEAVGVGLGIGAAFLGVRSFSVFGGGSGRDWEGLAWATMATMGGGLVLLLVGVGLDVDSGNRRSALPPTIGMSLGPLDGGAFAACTIGFF